MRYKKRNCLQEGFDNRSRTRRSGIDAIQQLASQNLHRTDPPDESPFLYIDDNERPSDTMKEDRFQSQGLCRNRGRYSPIVSDSYLVAAHSLIVPVGMVK